MIRKIRIGAALVLAGLVLLAEAKPEDGFVDGLVNVQARPFKLVSNEYGDSYFPGQKLSIDVSGTIDVNPRDRWEDDCFLGICKRHSWIEHQWFDATQLPVVFRLVDERDNKVAEFVSQNGKAEFLIPANVPSSAFNKRLRLLGTVAETTPSIDAARSSGQYTVRVRVDTSERIRQLPQYLADAKPTAAELKERWIYDPFLLEQNRSAVVRALINLAQSAYPATDTTKADDHRALLDYAAEIQPANTAVGAAAAEMYIQQGNFAAAEKQIVETIKTLRKIPGSADDPTTQSALARAYLSLAKSMSAARGYADADDISAIAAQYTSAIDIAKRFRAPVLQAEALFGRAFALRSRNTMDGLKAAQDDLKSARDRSPQPAAGLPSFVAPGAGEMLVNESPGKVLLTTRALFDAAAPARRVEVGPSFARFWGVSNKGKAYVSNDDNLAVVQLGTSNARFEPILPAIKDLTSVQSNDTYAILTRITSPSTPNYVPFAPYAFDMLREKPSGIADTSPILFDGKQPMQVLLATSADRYVALGQWTVTLPAAPVIPFEIRAITTSGETVVQRFKAEGLMPGTVRISKNGERVVGVVGTPTPPFIQKVMVWDANGTTTEVAAMPTGVLSPSAGRAPGLNLISSVDFLPDNNSLLIVHMDSAMHTAPVAANATLTPLVRDAQNRASGEVFVHRMLPTDRNSLLIEGEDAGGLFVQLFNAETRDLKMLRSPSRNVINVGTGYWNDGPRGISEVKLEPAPTAFRSVRTSDNATIGVSTVNMPEVYDIQLLKGGRFLCLVGPEIGLMDLTSKVYTTIAARQGFATPAPAPLAGFPPAPGPVPTEEGKCVSQRVRDGWVLLRHTRGAITSATVYVGAKVQGTQNAMPPVPPDIVDMNTAAAARLQRPFPPPAFMLPQIEGPGQEFSDTDGRMFSAAYPRAAGEEALIKGLTQWVSVPYVFLQDANLTVRRMRLPLGAFAMKILPQPQNKVIYAFRNQIFWKTLETDAEGVPLMDLPLPPTGLYLHQIATNTAGTRMIFGLQNYGPDGKIEIEQKIFDVTDAEVKLVPCVPCNRRSLNATLLMPQRSLNPFAWGVVQTDETLDHLILYQNDEQAAVFNVDAQRQVASLPFKNVIWFSDKRAFYLSGPREYSIIEY